MNKHFKVLYCELQDASLININNNSIPENVISVSLKLFSIYKYGKTWYERQGFQSFEKNNLEQAKKQLKKIKVNDIISQMKYFSELGKKTFLLPGENKNIFIKNFIDDFDICIKDFQDFHKKIFNERNISFVDAMNKLIKLSTNPTNKKLFINNYLKIYIFIERGITEYMPYIKQKIINKNNKNNKYFSNNISDILQEINETTTIMRIEY
jgi:hypothetical protein